VLIGSVNECSNIDPSSGPGELSILQEEVEEMLVLCLVPGLVT